MKRDNPFSERDELVPKGNDDDLKRYYSLRPMTVTAFKRICKRHHWKFDSFESIPCSEDSGTYEKFFFKESEYV